MAVEEFEEPKPEPKERTMTEGLGLTEAGMKMFEEEIGKEL